MSLWTTILGWLNINQGENEPTTVSVSIPLKSGFEQMKILTLRQPSSSACTQGEIQVNGIHHSWSLEPSDNFVNPEGHKGPIPCGVYQIKVTVPSVEFQCRFKPPLNEVAEFQNVPNRQAVYNHPGNTSSDTDSCVLNGFEKGKDFIGNSRPACADLLSKIKAAKTAGESVEWEIRYSQKSGNKEVV